MEGKIMFRISTYSRLLMSIVFTMLVAGLAEAQAPAGPKRPAAVPADFVVTPFGYFHPSCVNHLAKGDVLWQDENAIQRANRTYVVKSLRSGTSPRRRLPTTARSCTSSMAWSSTVVM